MGLGLSLEEICRLLPGGDKTGALHPLRPCTKVFALIQNGVLGHFREISQVSKWPEKAPLHLLSLLAALAVLAAAAPLLRGASGLSLSTCPAAPGRLFTPTK